MRTRSEVRKFASQKFGLTSGRFGWLTGTPGQSLQTGTVPAETERMVCLTFRASRHSQLRTLSRRVTLWTLRKNSIFTAWIWNDPLSVMTQHCWPWVRIGTKTIGKRKPLLWLKASVSRPWNDEAHETACFFTNPGFSLFVLRLITCKQNLNILELLDLLQCNAANLQSTLAWVSGMSWHLD